MSDRIVTHSKIVELHSQIAGAHIRINGFYRFDISEINGQFRAEVGMPTLLLESHSAEMYSENKMVSNFNRRNISFLLLDHCQERDDYARQNEILDEMENIGLDICSYLTKFSKDQYHWLKGLFDTNSFEMQKVGPLFDNMYGWNILYTLRNHEPMCYDGTKWDWPSE